MCSPAVGFKIRTCYAHLAGWLGVRIAESLEERGLIAQQEPRTYAVTPSGREWLTALGIEISFAKAEPAPIGPPLPRLDGTTPPSGGRAGLRPILALQRTEMDSSDPEYARYPRDARRQGASVGAVAHTHRVIC
jgi:hypothetical protein